MLGRMLKSTGIQRISRLLAESVGLFNHTEQSQIEPYGVIYAASLNPTARYRPKDYMASGICHPAYRRCHVCHRARAGPRLGAACAVSRRASPAQSTGIRCEQQWLGTLA